MNRELVNLQAQTATNGAPTETLTVESVTKTFQTKSGPVTALQDISLSMAAGEFYCVLGPSGCGKSTLLSIVAGLETPTTGKVILAGEGGGKEVTTPLAEMGVVFQRDLLLEWRTALDNVLLQYELRGMKPKPHRGTAMELLQGVGLADFADKYPWQLSGGMRQRIAICRALVHDPRLLLMDEPFGALDALSREQLNVELAALCSRTGKTTIFITHDIDEAVFLGHRIGVMSARPGRIVKEHRINLPRPRTDSVRSLPEFQEHVAEIRTTLRAEGVLP